MTTKVCTKCGKEKEFTEFHKRAGRKNGYVSQCKKCKSNYDKEHNTIRNGMKLIKNIKLKFKNYGYKIISKDTEPMLEDM